MDRGRSTGTKGYSILFQRFLKFRGKNKLTFHLDLRSIESDAFGHSARGLAHSMTLARSPCASKPREASGVRVLQHRFGAGEKYYKFVSAPCGQKRR